MHILTIPKTAILALFMALLASPQDLAAQGNSAISRHFASAAENSGETVNHGAWNALLERYVSLPEDGIARFAYGTVAAADYLALDDYLAHLAATRPSALSRNEQLAYWINLYNALTVKVILDHYPVRSIRRIKYGRFFAFGPWGRELISVEGFELSLDDIENQILRPVFDDPRIHYSINCASLGCPNLRAEAYNADLIDEQLNQAARDFVNHPRAAAVEGSRLTVSSIYVWFEQDFGGDDARVISHLRQYAEAELLEHLDGIDRISASRYDWTLNDTAPPD